MRRYGAADRQRPDRAERPSDDRPAEAGLREWLISRGRSGHVALYRHDPASDTVVALAIRHQRERR
ncbi:MAG: type II toxin-antitoxin system RelE/ParE family toxin [Burkholderiaceae bacterium]|jgi:hypothetical protein|nr:type II toxin-antitoxin system RelE/ParE family toxin [Burkholderiaceae bacterium]